MRRARGGRLLPVLAALFVALLLVSGCAAEGEDEVGSPVAAEEPEAPMEDKEKAALYAAIGGFVGKAWNGSGLFPDPCGQTPIQGVSCDLFNGVWYPTVVSVGPVLDNSLQCAPDARFSPQLFDLRRLKSLTFYACFPASNPTTIPATNWDKLAGTLETLEFRSNTGLAGAIPASLGRPASLQSPGPPYVSYTSDVLFLHLRVLKWSSICVALMFYDRTIVLSSDSRLHPGKRAAHSKNEAHM
ncbi:hypothetical protein TRIUR3_28561 [Triticum urartu]|uniref:Piriformospora indica-insensitive protein 2 n=1 Tax=Triticum urartu TaxID=4572 RepID=M8A436_TRIUA|nr:hypothetical protein TRIUR3_28561 [Triticum urartu]